MTQTIQENDQIVLSNLAMALGAEKICKARCFLFFFQRIDHITIDSSNPLILSFLLAQAEKSEIGILPQQIRNCLEIPEVKKALTEIRIPEKTIVEIIHIYPFVRKSVLENDTLLQAQNAIVNNPKLKRYIPA